jgi:tetratricopeptide (TPR) repeat protein
MSEQPPNIAEKRSQGTNETPRSAFWNAVGKWLGVLQKLFTLSGITVGGIALLFIFLLSEKQTIVVDRFSIAEDIKRTGYDEGAVARELADRIQAMMHETTSLKDYRSAYSYDNEPLVQVEASNLTLKSIAELIDRLRTKRRYLVTGELTHQSNQDMRLTVRVGDHPAISVTGPIDDIGKALDKSAEYILSSTEPYIYAAYLLTHNNTDEALSWIKKCLADTNSSNRPWAYNLWGVYYLERGHLDEAIDRFRKAIELDPKFSVAYLNWGVALENQHKLELALEKYQQSARYRKSASALAGQGRMLVALGDLEGGTRITEEAVRLASNERALHIDLANAYIQAQHFDQALAQLEIARDLGSLDLGLEAKLAWVLEQLGLRDRAIETYRRILNADTQDPQASLKILAKQRLDNLTGRQEGLQ